MLKSCWVVRTELVDNLMSADITPRKTGVQMAAEQLSGMSPAQITAEERALEQRPVITNEVHETGLKLTLRMADTGNEFTRFLSMSDLNEMAFGTPGPPLLMTPELAMTFGRMLMQRSEPITMAIVDSSVDLEQVRRSVGGTPNAVDGGEHGLSFIPRDGGR